MFTPELCKRIKSYFAGLYACGERPCRRLRPQFEVEIYKGSSQIQMVVQTEVWRLIQSGFHPTYGSQAVTFGVPPAKSGCEMNNVLFRRHFWACCLNQG
jgi:hypothetical protein